MDNTPETIDNNTPEQLPNSDAATCEQLRNELKKVKTRSLVTVIVACLVLVTICFSCVFVSYFAIEKKMTEKLNERIDTINEGLAQNFTDKLKSEITSDVLASYLRTYNLPEDYSSVALHVYDLNRNAIAEISCTHKDENGDYDQKGTAIILNTDGYLLTCYHILTYTKSVQIAGSTGEYVWVDQEAQFTNGEVYANVIASISGRYAVEIVAFDKTLDLAILKLPDELTSITPVTICNSGYANIGEDVAVLGNTHGMGITVTTGVLTSTQNATNSYGTLESLQTDASVYKGDSGGGLFNVYGELYGLISFKLFTTELGSDLGYAIASTEIIKYIDKVNGELGEEKITYTLSHTVEV